MLVAFKKNGFAYYSLSLVAFIIIMMSLILFRLFGRLYPALSGQMPSYMLLGDRVFYILVPQDPVCELSLVG